MLTGTHGNLSKHRYDIKIRLYESRRIFVPVKQENLKCYCVSDGFEPVSAAESGLIGSAAAGSIAIG